MTPKGMPDGAGDFARYLAARKGPRFVHAYRRARGRYLSPRPLCINGHEYHRRQKARKAS